MLHILFMILKILGIVLVSVLALILLILLIVLLVPIRYQLYAKKRDEIIVKMRVNWLLRIVFVRIWYIDEMLHIRLRIFGIPIWDNLNPREKETKKKSKNREKRRDIVKKLEDVKPTLELKTKQDEFTDSKIELIESEPMEEDQSDHNEPNKQSKLRKIVERIASFFHRINKVIKKIPRMFASLSEKASHVKELFTNLINKKNKIIAFLKNEINKAGIKSTLVQVLAILRHCAPQKLRGYIKFGLEDPATTGYLLGVASIIYAKFQGTITFEPDFEKPVLEAEVMGKGRIRIFSLLIIVIRLIRDKNFKELLKNVKQIKEELV